MILETEENKNNEEKNNLNETENVVENAVEENKEVEAQDVNQNIAETELSKLKEEYDELDDRYKRMLAEFENYKKRSQKEKEGIYGMITADVVAVMLPIMDNLEKAGSTKTDDEKYQEGIKLVARQFREALKSLGLEEIETVGQRFNPEFHEAVSHIEDESKGEQEIVQEYRKGYKIGNKVVRHSMVIVAN